MARRFDARHRSAAITSLTHCCRCCANCAAGADHLRHRRPALPARTTRRRTRRTIPPRAPPRRARERRNWALIARSDAHLVVSEAERDLLATDAPEAQVDVLSNLHRSPGTRPASAQRRDLVFVGSFRHPPNVDAALWLVRRDASRWCARSCPTSGSTWSAPTRRRSVLASPTSRRATSTATCPTSTPCWTAPDRRGAAALRRRHQGQGQPEHGARTAGGGDALRGRRHAPASMGEDVLVADDAAGIRRRRRAPATATQPCGTHCAQAGWTTPGAISRSMPRARVIRGLAGQPAAADGLGRARDAGAPGRCREPADAPGCQRRAGGPRATAPRGSARKSLAPMRSSA